MEEAGKLPWSKLPAPVLELVRSSCADLLRQNPHVTLDDACLGQFVAELDHRALQKLPKKMFPLNFPTQRSEINFICTLALLQIGSGWRRALHAQKGGKGAAETITFGCMGMHISGEINSSVMINVGLFDVAQLFGLKIQEDYEISRGIHSERPTELYSLAEAIRGLLNSAGTMLRNLHCEDWAEFWLGSSPNAARIQQIDPATNAPVRPKAQDAVARLVRHFTGLQDAYILPVKKGEEQKEQEEAKQTGAAAVASATPVAASSATSDAAATPASAAAAAAEPAAASAAPAAAAAASSSSSSSASSAAPATSCAVGDHRIVYLLKKAQLMVADLYLRFGDESDSPFAFSDINDLTVFSDNVLPAVLRASGVLQYSDELGELVDSNTPIANREQEASIRAAAVVACEQIVAKYNAKNATAEDPTPLSAMSLDYHLWLAGKNPQFRQLARHATHSIYY